MASRKIAVHIVVENRQAIIHTQQQTAATNQLNQAVQGQTHLQAGLTNSFIKGNLAARAISMTYIALRDAVQDMVKTGIEFQFTMAKIEAISGEGGESIKSLEGAIRNMALSSMKSAPEIAKVANEMGKLGLTNKQVEALIGSVTTLGVALDEDLVVAGETVVKVLNTYGLSVSQGQKISEQLAYTVAASALDLEKFGTAFSYVGGTAAVAGVKFEDLAGAMDFLSNAGIKSSTIGTQLRRIIADLADENSKASKAIGGTANSMGGLIPALKKLDEVLPKDSDKRIATLTDMFGRTATSVAALIIKNADAIKQFSDNTANATGNLGRMKGVMDDTFAAALAKHSNAWRELGMQIGEVVGPAAKGLLNVFTDLIKALATGGDEMDKFYARQYGKPKAMGMGDLRTMDEANLKSELDAFTKSQAAKAEAEAQAADASVEVLKEKFAEIRLLMERDTLMGKNVNFSNYIKQYEGLVDSFRKLGSLEDEVAVLREIERIESKLEKKTAQTGFALPNLALYSMTDRNIGNRTRESSFAEDKLPEPPKEAYLFADIDQGKLDNFNTWLIETTDQIEVMGTASEISAAQIMASFVGMKAAVDGVNGSVDILSYYFVEGIFSDKKDPFKGISDAFGNFAKKMAADLVALVAKILIFRAVLAATGFLAPGAVPFVSAVANASVPGYKFASGTDQYVDRPTMFMAGEAGRERVQVTPKGRSGGGASIVVNIQGDVYGGEKFAEAVDLAQKKLNRSYI